MYKIYIIMKKFLLFFVSMLVGFSTYAQVGIGTNDPKSTLHIVGDTSDNTVPDGVIFPSLTCSNLFSKYNNPSIPGAYGTDQDGVLVNVTIDVVCGTAAPVTNVSQSGVHRYVFNSGTMTGEFEFIGSNNTDVLISNRIGVGSTTNIGNVYTITNPNAAVGSRIIANYEDPSGNVTTLNINASAAGSFSVTAAEHG